jgi:hypothetical protein
MMRFLGSFLLLTLFWMPACLIGQDSSFFLLRLGEANTPELSWCLIETPEGYVIGGGQDDRSFIRAYDHADQLLWHRTFDFTNEDDFIRKLFLDTDGFIIGTGRDKAIGGDRSFIFRYDYQNDQMDWVQRVAFVDESRFEEIVESGPDGNLFIFGQTYLDPGPGFAVDLLKLELDRETGAIIGQTNLDQGLTDTYIDAIATSNGIYASGIERYTNSLGSIRPIVTRFTEEGEQIWTKTYIEPVNGSARVYFTCIIEQQDTLVIAGRGTLEGDDLTNGNTHLVKLDLQGSILAAATLDILEGNSERALEIIEFEDGYVVCGDFIPTDESERNIFLIRTDHNFNPVWSRSLGGEDDESSVECIEVNGSIYIAGFTGNGNDQDVIFCKVSGNGSPREIPTCNWWNDITVSVTPFVNPYEGFSMLNSYEKNFEFSQPQVNPESSTIQADSICWFNFTSVRDIEKSVSASILPNPTTDDFQLVVEGLKGDSPVGVEIIDAKGRVLEYHRLDSFGERLSGEFSLVPYPAGLYYVRIIYSGQSTIIKVMKQ